MNRRYQNSEIAAPPKINPPREYPLFVVRCAGGMRRSLELGPPQYPTGLPPNGITISNVDCAAQVDE
jgi:hypothetical protein